MKSLHAFPDLHAPHAFYSPHDLHAEHVCFACDTFPCCFIQVEKQDKSERKKNVLFTMLALVMLKTKHITLNWNLTKINVFYLQLLLTQIKFWKFWVNAEQ